MTTVTAITPMLKVYAANLAKYNGGRLVGEWIDLPTSREELEEQIAKILGTDEEIAIHDHEGMYKRVSQYDNIYTLNEQLEELQNAADSNGISSEALEVILNGADSLEEAISDIENGIRVYTDVKNYEDVAQQHLEESGYFHNLKESLQHGQEKSAAEQLAAEIETYFDFEAYGRDMEHNDSWYEDFTIGIAVQVFR
jgi:antirestriction protein